MKKSNFLVLLICFSRFLIKIFNQKLNSVNHSQAEIKLSEIVDKHQISYLKPKKSNLDLVSNVQVENMDTFGFSRK